MPKGNSGGTHRGVKYVAANCSNTTENGVSLHNFPKDKVRRKQNLCKSKTFGLNQRNILLFAQSIFQKSVFHLNTYFKWNICIQNLRIKISRRRCPNDTCRNLGDPACTSLEKTKAKAQLTFTPRKIGMSEQYPEEVETRIFEERSCKSMYLNSIVCVK